MKIFKQLIEWFTKLNKNNKSNKHYSVSFDSSVVMNKLPPNEEEVIFYKMKVRPNFIFEIIAITNKTKKSSVREVSYREISTGKEGRMDEDLFYFNFEKVSTPKLNYKKMFLQKTLNK
jgi:hypothetical protein